MWFHSGTANRSRSACTDSYRTEPEMEWRAFASHAFDGLHASTLSMYKPKIVCEEWAHTHIHVHRGRIYLRLRCVFVRRILLRWPTFDSNSILGSIFQLAAVASLLRVYYTWLSSAIPSLRCLCFFPSRSHITHHFSYIFYFWKSLNSHSVRKIIEQFFVSLILITTRTA